MSDRTPTVLLHDPDASVRTTLHWILIEHGLRIISAASLADVVALAARHQPDVIVVGFNGDMEAIESVGAAMRAVRKLPRAATSQFIVTGFAMPVDLGVHALEWDADFVPKPFRMTVFLALVRRAIRRSEAARRPGAEIAMQWDVFVSHASEDKESFVRPLATRLRECGVRVWFDEFTLRVGDSLRRTIDRGIAGSRFGLVVLSPSFFKKEWPQRELEGLLAGEQDGRKRLLPLWHDINIADLRQISPTLADRVALDSSRGIDDVAAEILAVLGGA